MTETNRSVLTDEKLLAAPWSVLFDALEFKSAPKRLRRHAKLRSQNWGTCAVGDALDLRHLLDRDVVDTGNAFGLVMNEAPHYKDMTITTLKRLGHEFTDAVLKDDIPLARECYDRVRRFVNAMLPVDTRRLLFAETRSASALVF